MILPPAPLAVAVQPPAASVSAGAQTRQDRLFPLTALPATDDPEPPPTEAEIRATRPPAWIRPPTVAEVRALYPPAAAADGVGGVTQVVCRVEADTTLSRCYSDDAKGGYGFGAAMLRLTPLLRIRRKTVDGKPVENGRALFTIRFDPPDDAKPVRAFWTASPTAAEVQAALPRIDGRPATTGGRGVMHCAVSAGLLSACRAAGDGTDPFSRAAIRLAPRFAIDKAFPNGRSTESVVLTVPVVFEAPGSKPPVPVLENPVRFIHAPTNAQKLAVFPQAAKDHGVSTLSVSEACTVAADGSLTRCHAAKEDPTGLGGAQAAARLVNAFQLSTWTLEGRPVAGAAVTVDIVWAPLPGAAAASVTPTDPAAAAAPPTAAAAKPGRRKR